MQGNGGIADAETVREDAVTSVLSGPAAGVVGAAAFEDRATDAGDSSGSAPTTDGLVTFDMGGTSTDVSLVQDGSVERTTDADVGDHPVRVPLVDVQTVGAGGGSIAWVDAGGALRVGPRSAGADPGPACYGNGGVDPTVTDASVLLGYLGPDTTLGADLSLDVTAARSALADLAEEAGLAGPDAAAAGVYRVANVTMTRAIRSVTLERGHDPRSFALVAFGGAGPMHAAALADHLAIERVVVPPTEGVLSAFGLLAAEERHDAVLTHRTPVGDADVDAIESVYEDLSATVLADTSDPDAATVERWADCRYHGQSFELSVRVPDQFDPETVATRFHETHEAVRGYRMSEEPVTVVTLRTTATVPGDRPALSHDPSGDAREGEREAAFPRREGEGGSGTPELRRLATPVYDRERVPPGAHYDGPAVFEGGESTVVLPPHWQARVAEDGTLVLEVDA
jgi:N-methylhydantoinase A